jgi:hypothetical protein
MRILFSAGVFFLSISGCNQSTPEPDAVSAKATEETQEVANAETRGEFSEAGWPHTTKKYSGEFVYVAPDGTEKVLSLGDNTVATISGKFNEGKDDEMAYELKYLRHRDGKDLYEITYQTGPHHHTTVGPFGYSGTETPIGNKGQHGKFILRPESR